MKFTCILLPFLFIGIYTRAQLNVKNYKPIKAYEQYRLLIMKAFEKNNSQHSGSVMVDGVPDQFFDTTKNFSIHPVFKFQIEFPPNYTSSDLTVICKDAEFLIIIPDNGNISYEFDLKDNTIALLGKNRSIRYCPPVENAGNSEVSFFYLFDKDKYLGNDAFICSNQSTVYFNCSTSRKFPKVSDFLINKYSTIDSFRDLVKQEEENNSLTTEAFKNFDVKKDSEGFVKNSFKYHCIFLPADTSKNITYLLNDIKKPAGLNAKQSELIRTGIKNLLATAPDPNSSFDSLKKYPERLKSYIVDLKKHPEISFMGRNIVKILRSVLTDVQYSTFQHHLKVEDLQFHRVDQYIYHDYLDQRYPDIKTKGDAYKSYILSLLNN